MNRIAELDQKTVQKIAAGEVIERPASIVKELIENSIDAQASIITVEIKEGGKSLIRVTDNGSGIIQEDLELAFKRHSTSKLRQAEDLYNIHSLGFRGEALASISAVSRIKIMTKTKEAQAGLEADVEDGLIVEQNLIGAPQGTTIMARDLFYNLPVRRDFLKSNLIESNRISDIVYKLALGNPSISFNYIKDDKLILKTNRSSNMKNHIYSILGKDLSQNLIDLNLEEEGFSLSGYITNNHYYRGNRSHQYIFLNDRFIKSDSISRVIEDQYKSLIPLNKYPAFIIFLNIDPSKIDVNIHPSKQEVKFTQEEEILDKFKALVKARLFPEIQVGQVKFTSKKETSKSEIPNLFDFIEESKSQEEEKLRSEPLRVEEEGPLLIEDYRQEEVDSDLLAESQELLSYEDQAQKDSQPKISMEQDRRNIDRLQSLGVVFNTFILAQDSLDEKLYFIDQHAAHERVMYEKYVREYNEEDIHMQILLSPMVIDLSSQEMEKFKSGLSIFRSLGFDLEEFGNSSIIIRSIPILFGQAKLENLFYSILDNLNEDIQSNYDSKLDKIMKIACVNSVKSGDKLDKIEILSLFKSLQACSMPYTCPHGRPTMLEMSRKDLEKEFLRII